MAVATDFIAPEGELTADMFPGDTLATNVQAYLDQAELKAADNEDAQTAWVYYRAWTAVANRLATEPSSIDIEGEGSRQYLVPQMAAAQARANYWRSEYESLTASTVSKRSYPVMRSLR